MYKKLTAAIAATIMITALFASLGTAGAAENSVTVSPDKVKGDTRVEMTFTVNNNLGEDIENILIRPPSDSFSEPIGGSSAADSLGLAADNLDKAATALNRAGENLKLIEEPTGEAGTYLKDAASSLDETARGGGIALGSWENVWGYLLDAAVPLDQAGNKLKAEPENLVSIASLLRDVSTKLDLAAGNYPDENENFAAYNIEVAENIDQAAKTIGGAATELEGGSLISASTSLVTAGNWLEKAGTALSDNHAATGSKLQDVGAHLKSAGEKLDSAADRESDASANLRSAAIYISNAAGYVESTDTSLADASDNLDKAAAQIDAAGGSLGDNLLQAGANLANASPYLHNAADELGSYFGGDELAEAPGNIRTAGSELSDRQAIDLTGADNALSDAASDLSATVPTINSTADSLSPANWTLTEGQPEPGDVRFDGINDVIASGDSENFTYIWRSRDINAEEDYTLELWAYGTDSGWVKLNDLTITVDEEDPSLIIEARQEGVEVSNLVGDEYQDETATVVVRASEKVSLGDVTINAGSDNLMQPLSLVTFDNKTFFGSFVGGEWDDDNTKVVVGSATDTLGNKTEASENFCVDTRPPIFLDNGIPDLKSKLIRRVQAGTGDLYRTISLQPIGPNILDNSGKGNHATEIPGDPTVVEGKFGNAMKFDKDVQGSIIAPDLEPSEMTVMFWLKLEESENPDEHFKFMRNSRPTNTNAGWRFMAKTKKRNDISFRVGTGTDSSRIKLKTTKDVGGGYADGEWHHIAATCDGSTQELYYDGSKVASTSITSFDPHDPDPFEISVRVGWAADEIRLYDRTLDSGEINDIYESNAPVKSGQLLRYKLDKYGYYTPSLTMTLTGSVEDNWSRGPRLGWRDNTATVKEVTVEWADNSAVFEHMPRYFNELPGVSTPDSSFSLDMTLSEGVTSETTVTATDWTGNTTSTTLENILIDTQKPEIKFGDITGVDYTKDLADGVIMNDDTPKVDLTVTDPGYPDSGFGVSEENLDVRVDSKSIEGSWDPSTGSFEATLSALSEGSHTLSVTANDNLNENVTDNVSFKIDTVEPSISSTPTGTTIKLGTSANPEVSKEGTLEITGTAEPGATVEVLVNGEVKATTTAESPWSATITLEEGKNKIQPRATDTAGNKNLVTYGYILSDSTAPSITIEEPSEDEVLGSKSVTVSGSVSDETTSVSELTIAGETVPVAGGEFSTSITADEGTRTINLAAADEANNTSSESVSVTVDATRPVAEITSPQTGLLTDEGSVEIQVKAYDEATSVEATLNGETITLNDDGTFSKSVSLDLGSNTISLSAKDEADHYATDSITLVSDTEDPSVTVTAPEDATTTSNASITVEGSVTDEPAETSMAVRINAGTTSREVALNEDGSFSTTIPLPEGDTTITVSATDEANNTGIGSVSVTRTVPGAANWPMYATFAAIIAIILAAIAVLRRET